jgi:putative ABC transport system ATP-binding protein
MSNTGGPAIVLSNVTRTYDGGLVRALDGVDLEVARGEWVSLSGPSGCGKSTLLHLTAGLDRPTSGSIHVDGHDIAGQGSLDEFRRATLGLVFQFHYLLPNFSGLQNVLLAMFGSGRSGREKRQRARELLAEVGVAGKEKQRPNTLSGGERQRVAIARALANDPPILLADEPTGALDSSATQVVLELFRRIQRERGVTILLVTHDPVVAATGDRTVYMRDGRVVASAAEAHGAAAAAWARGSA